MGGDGWKLGYRPELNGLRALAVVLVMLAHCEVTGFKVGGVVGVTMFFTLSGFLITALLLEEHDRGGIRLRSFWRRRIVRLLPALVVLMAALLMLQRLRLMSEMPSGWELAGVFGYVANWLRVAGHPLNPINHTWSLAVEEQFYIVWPLLVVGVLKWRRNALLPTVIGLFVMSVALRVGLWVVLDDPVNRVYFGTDTNAFALLAGCALAIGVRRWGVPRLGRPVCWVVMATLFVTMGGLALPPWGYEYGTTFICIIAPLLAVALTVVLMLVLLGGAGRAWRWKPLLAVGMVSYGLYLWHVPMISVWAMYGPGGPEWTPVGVFTLTGMFTYLSWVLVERPMMRFRGTRTSSEAQDLEIVSSCSLEARGGSRTTALRVATDPTFRRRVVQGRGLAQSLNAIDHDSHVGTSVLDADERPSPPTPAPQL